MCFDFLQNKYQGNQKIKLYPYVVGEKKLDSIKFNYSCQNPGTSYLYHSPVKDRTALLTDWDIIDRKQVSINDIVDKSIDTVFIKIDAEGHDFFVLKGSDWILKNQRPFVLFEFSGKQNCEDYGYSPKEWYDFFRNNNYELFTPMGGKDFKWILSHFNTFHPNLIDILAVPVEKTYILQ
jgi:FkbM family methyltransferase